MDKGRYLFSLYQIFSPIFHALSRKKNKRLLLGLIFLTFSTHLTVIEKSTDN